MWEILKEAYIKKCRPSPTILIGRALAVNSAANLFVALREYWKEGDLEAFNKDDDVWRAAEITKILYLGVTGRRAEF